MIAAMSKSMVVAQGGVEFYGLNYAGYPSKDLIESAGGKFRSLVKWNPDDMGNMFVRHPRSQEWVNLPCTRPDYACGLTWNQHRLLRDFTRKDIQRNYNVGDLLRSKDRLCQVWMEPLARKNKSLEADAAKRYAGKVTNALGYVDVETSTTTTPLAQPSRLIAEEDLVFDAAEIPMFETYSL